MLCRNVAQRHGLAVEFRQSNHEGDIIDSIQEAGRSQAAGIILNAAAYTHSSIGSSTRSARRKSRPSRCISATFTPARISAAIPMCRWRRKPCCAGWHRRLRPGNRRPRQASTGQDGVDPMAAGMAMRRKVEPPFDEDMLRALARLLDELDSTRRSRSNKTACGSASPDRARHFSPRCHASRRGP